jgi:hypothetical protein
MYVDLPIQQLLRRKDTRFQLGFAHEAREILPQSDEFHAAPCPKGLQVLGRNEDALERPVEVLRDVYGAKIHVRPPEVRLIEGVQIKQPVMHVRIRGEKALLAAVKRALLERGAVPEEEDVQSTLSSCATRRRSRTCWGCRPSSRCWAAIASSIASRSATTRS